MKPQWYVDIRVAQAVSERGPSGGAIDAIASFLKIVHGCAKAGGFAFATALPLMRTGSRAHPGTVLRIFTQEREQCDSAADAIEANEMARGAAVLSRVRPVPAGVKESVTYARYRIASRKSALQVDGFARRITRMRHGDELPYLKLRSKTTGQSYSLRVRLISCDGAPSTDCEPDGYGLSVTRRQFSLPLLPVAPAPWERLLQEARGARRVDDEVVVG